MKSQIIDFMSETKTKDVYSQLIQKVSARDFSDNLHGFVQMMMDLYEDTTGLDRSIHGKYFEYIVGESLALSGIKNMYYQATVNHVPLAMFDWFLYDEIYPVSISCKTKARERWKQAAYEGLALKQVYVGATNYLVTLEPTANIGHKKINAPRSIDHFIVATQPEYTKAIKRISERQYSRAELLPPLKSGTFVRI
ncbi:MAG: hypothetical protein OXC63_07015 [Aestuariivita sp.]|nr:hypothetical protein [Aestuariivita sp.]MCY4345650.1 hypothetical protein [Aestuariivita sp.]